MESKGHIRASSIILRSLAATIAGASRSIYRYIVVGLFIPEIRPLTIRPNHEELLAIYDQPCKISTFQELQEVISNVIHHLLDNVGVGPNGAGAVVVRCGRHGSCVGTKSKGIKWFPAYFTEQDSGRVIDVSGGKFTSCSAGSMKLTS
jgi:hypothetical protein